MKTTVPTTKLPKSTRANGTLPEAQTENVTISPPKFQTAEFHIVGNAPYVQAAFPAKAKAMMRAKHEAGGTARLGRHGYARPGVARPGTAGSVALRFDRRAAARQAW